MQNDISGLIRQLSTELRQIKNAQPDQESLTIVSHVLAKPNTWLLAHSDEAMPNKARSQALRIARQRRSGIPLAYILGNAIFFGRPFIVNRHVLIPRPETEELVEIILKDIMRDQHVPNLLIADIGTGSGCIVISLLLELRRRGVVARGTSIDISEKALRVSKENAHKHHVLSAVRFIQGNLTEPLRRKVDVLVANLPYLATAELTEPSIAAEPRTALWGGADGLDLIRSLIEQLPRKLTTNGTAYLEIGFRQGRSVKNMAHANGLYADILPDLSGRDRFARIRHKG